MSTPCGQLLPAHLIYRLAPCCSHVIHHILHLHWWSGAFVLLHTCTTQSQFLTTVKDKNFQDLMIIIILSFFRHVFYPIKDVHPLPDKPNLGSSNSAANKDMMLKVWTNRDTIIWLSRKHCRKHWVEIIVENIVGKGEIAHYEQFLLFP